MDPNATLQLILDAVADNDDDAFSEAWHSLQEWIDKAGAMPRNRDMGVVHVRGHHRVDTMPRKILWNPDRTACLCCTDPLDHSGPWEYRRYADNGDMVTSRPFT
jgi:hypothetical protein